MFPLREAQAETSLWQVMADGHEVLRNVFWKLSCGQRTHPLHRTGDMFGEIENQQLSTGVSTACWKLSWKEFPKNPCVRRVTERISTFQENSIPQTVKRKKKAEDFPQNFQEIFPFNSTISAQFHSADSAFSVFHFFTFFQERRCGRKRRKKSHRSAGSGRFQLFRAPYYYYYFIFMNEMKSLTE